MGDAETPDEPAERAGSFWRRPRLCLHPFLPRRDDRVLQQSNAGNNNPPGENTLSQRYDDPYYIRNITRATAAGMYAGTYHFSRPDIIASTLNSGGVPNNGTDEANHFMQMASPWMRPGYLMPVHDLEAGDGARTDNEMAQFTLDFSNRIYQVMGIRPAIYTNGNYANFVIGGASQALRDEVVATHPTLWSARWPNQTNPGSINVQTGEPKDSYTPIYGPWDDYGETHPWEFWQYASTMRLNGNNLGASNTDVNVVHGNMEYLKDRLIPAIWMNSSSGSWKDLTNWNSGVTPVAPVQGPGQVARVGNMTLPGARLPGTPDPNNAANGTNVTGVDDTVNLIRDDANITVTFDAATPVTTIRKLNLYEHLNVTGSTLNVTRNGWFGAGGQLSITGGTISVQQATFDSGSTLEFLGGGALSVATLNLGTNVAYNGASGTGLINARAGAVSPAVDFGGQSRTFTIADGSASLDLNVSIPITNGQLTKSGAGTLALTAANTYAGGTTINAGTVQLGNGTGTAGSFGGGAVINNGAIVVNFGATAAAIGNGISGSGSVMKIGTGVVTLSGSNSYTGGTTVNVGTLTATGVSALGAATSPLAVNNPNTGTATNVILNLSTTAPTTVGSLNGTLANASSGTNTATINNGGQLFTVNQTNTTTYQGVVAGAGGFTKAGPGTLTLGGTNTYTGGTTVQAGTLAVNRLHAGNAVNITGGALRVLASSPTLPAHPSGSNSFVSRPSSLLISNNGAPLGSRVYNGTLDLANNDLILDYSGATPIAGIEDMVRSGFNGSGNWLGSGITSSLAAADGNYVLAVADNASLAAPFGTAQGGPLFAGVNVDLTSVLIKFTHRADLDLDGLITPNDAAIFGGHYSEGGFANWATGDMNYDRVFTPTDAAIFGGFYDQSLASLPEPVALGLLAIAGLCLTSRHARR